MKRMVLFLSLSLILYGGAMAASSNTCIEKVELCILNAELNFDVPVFSEPIVLVHLDGNFSVGIILEHRLEFIQTIPYVSIGKTARFGYYGLHVTPPKMLDAYCLQHNITRQSELTNLFIGKPYGL